MSMCLINAVNHRIIDIIPERNNKFLRNYFIQYSYEARLSVITIIVDLYAPYQNLIKDLMHLLLQINFMWLYRHIQL